MKYYRIFLFVILIIPLQPVESSAETYENCKEALLLNDAIMARKFAKHVSRFTSIPMEERETTRKCFELAFGESFSYDARSGKFVSQEDRTNLEASRRERDEAKRQKLAEQRDREAQLEEAQARALEAARREEKTNISLVWQEVYTACEQEYFRNRFETLTNRVCLDLFLEIGLPER